MTGSTLRQRYRIPLVLLTDLYQLTMANGYWKTGKADMEAVFHLFFRQNPFEGGFAVTAGLEDALSYLDALAFESEDLDYLAGLRGKNNEPLFEEGFLRLLVQAKFRCDVDAIPEGTVVFPREPLVRVQGPIWQAQIVESALLNILNFQTLVATKAARITEAAGDQPVMEFGLRRAQGVDGALAASRAAYLGGCTSTSNVLAGRIYGIPVRGTHAHSWVMAFDSEVESFEAYAAAMPGNCVFLVDTYDTLDGVENAIATARKMREAGHEMIGIRLDSGDLAYLSIEARQRLDEAGFPEAKIVASNDLDERLIMSLNQQGAKIDIWGVGTKLVTAFDQPALGGVYKLSALREGQGAWRYKVKLSEQAIKITDPGILQVRRYYREDGSIECDVIWDTVTGSPQKGSFLVDPMDLTRRKEIPTDDSFEDLLRPVMRQGERCSDLPSLGSIREQTKAQIARLHPGIRRYLNPHEYPVGLESRLFDRKMELVLEARRQNGSETP